MPIGVLNWGLRDTDGELGNGKGWILTLLHMHSNARGRCWPGMERISKNAGYGLAKTDEIVDWLEARGAIIKVPYKRRELEEKTLHQRKSVYQMTGVLQLDSGWIPYVRVDDHPEQLFSFIALVTNVLDASPVKDSLVKILTTKIFTTKISPSESEGITSLQGITSSSEGETSSQGYALSDVMNRWQGIKRGTVTKRDRQIIPLAVKTKGIEFIWKAMDRAEERATKPIGSWNYIVKVIEDMSSENGAGGKAITPADYATSPHVNNEPPPAAAEPAPQPAIIPICDTHLDAETFSNEWKTPRGVWAAALFQVSLSDAQFKKLTLSDFDPTTGTFTAVAPTDYLRNFFLSSRAFQKDLKSCAGMDVLLVVKTPDELKESEAA